MIQRIQTVYLLLAALVAMALPFVVSLYEDASGTAMMAKDDYTILALFMASGVLSLVTIFLFKNRKLQFVLGRLNILLNFALLGVLIYRSQILSGGAAALEKGIGMVLPLISIVLIVLANKAIKRDENLVKSVDRLR